MVPVKFPGVNFTFMTNEPNNKPLPLLKTPDGMYISCWELSDEEIDEIIKSRRIYISQFAVNRVINPVLPASNLADGLI